MRRYSEAVKADVRRRMSPPHRRGVATVAICLQRAELYQKARQKHPSTRSLSTC